MIKNEPDFAEKPAISQFLKLNGKEIEPNLWTIAKEEIRQNLFGISEDRYPHMQIEFLRLLISLNPNPAANKGSAKENEAYKNLWARISEKASTLDHQGKIEFVEPLVMLTSETNRLQLTVLSDNCFKLYLDLFEDIKNSNDFHNVLSRHLQAYAPCFTKEQNLEIYNRLTDHANKSFDTHRKASSLVLMKKVCRTAALTFLLFARPKIGIPLIFIDRTFLKTREYYLSRL